MGESSKMELTHPKVVASSARDFKGFRLLSVSGPSARRHTKL